ncbi:MAG: hypothetical protein ISF22_07680 [Methanomassiliicoccus sp.]|nr:hypothetical protein [Methanomassiliicoccus sp.]
MSWHDLLFARLPALLPSARVPSDFNRIMRSARSSAGSRWLLRNEIEEDVVRKGAWNLLVITATVAFFSLTVMAALFGPMSLAYGIVPALLAPIIASSLYLNAPDSFGQAEARRMLGEAPAVIGCMTMSMQVQPSLEHAVLFASERSEGVLPQRLREAMWVNLTRSRGSLTDAINDLCSSLSAEHSALKQSLHLVVSATCERTRQGTDRLLDKANAVALGGVRDAAGSYAASLSLPTMVLFSLGTLLPIMLFSLLPLLTLGTSLGEAPGSALPFPYLAFLLLVVIPLSAFLYAWTILARNPLGMVSGGRVRIGRLFPPAVLLIWAGAVAAAAIIDLGGLRPYALSASMVLVPCAYLAWNLRGHGSSLKRKRVLEREATAALFHIGNRMVSGATFERALEDAGRDVGESAFREVARALLYRSRLSGKGLDEIMVEEGSLRAASAVVENAFVTVAQCADRDPRYAGQIALNLAQMLSDLQACQVKVEESLRGVVEMMRSTSMVFAPIVLGVTGALFSLIETGTAAAGGMAGDIGLITGIYIGQLSLLVAFFTVLINGERSWKSVAHCFATRTPVAFLIFVVVSLICRTALNGLM